MNISLLYRRLDVSAQVLCFALLAGLFSCKKDGNVGGNSIHSPGEETLTASAPLLQLLQSTVTGIDFQNTIDESFENNITTNINIYNGGGVAIADVNNDGLPDIYFVSSTGKNRLYQNLGAMKFKDVTDAAGLASEGGFETAVTAVDINADGWMDFYVCRAGPIQNDERRNRLFVNNGLTPLGGGAGGVTFTDKAKEYGLDDPSASSGANFFDYDLDGDLDLYLLNYPSDFTWASKIDARPNADSTKAVLNTTPKQPLDTDRFYRNDTPLRGGKGVFTDVSKQAGIWNFAYGLSVSVSDFNADGYPDVYVGNDFIQPDMLYINTGKGAFINELGRYFRHTSQHTMGTEISDFDNDGLPDLFAVDMLGNNNYRQKTVQNTNSQSRYTTLMQYGYFEPVVRNVLQRNTGNNPLEGAGGVGAGGGQFSDIGCLSGVYKTDWSWSGLFADLDNDGWKDLSITNGYRREVGNFDFINFTFPKIKEKNIPIRQQFKSVYDFLNLIPTYKLRNFVWQNKGDWTFSDQSGKWMSISASWSNGAAYADLDADGDLDYIVNNLDEPAFIYQNLATEQSKGNYLQCLPEGSPQNPKGVGAAVAIWSGGQVQYQEMNPTRGIFSSMEHLLHFGLGKAATVDKLVIRWHDGKGQTLTNVPANQRLTLKYAEATEKIPPRFAVQNNTSPTLFKDLTTASGLDFRHEENQFNDFENFFLQPWKVTELGPLMASADVNADGLTDLYIGNSFEKKRGLYLQNANGTFSLTSPAAWAADARFEDHGAAFFDADMDGDPDLYVVSGGAEATAAEAWRHRLYINLGGGKFQGIGNTTGVGNALPPLQDVALRMCAHDFDGDGDQDLFIGGRLSPGKYPLTPKSYLLRNDRSKFTDATAELAPGFGQCGMVTDLAWANLDSDPALELVVVGEWMPVTVFKIKGGKLQKADPASMGFDRSEGLWNRLYINDLNGDGDLDLVTGNLGLNTRFTATPDAPLRCYAKDFDNNGSVEPVMAFHEGDQIFPLVQRDPMVRQMPGLKKNFLHFSDYAAATVDKIFSQKDLDASLQLKAHLLETCWWENRGGKFLRHDLPVQAQASPVFGILAHDFDGDGKTDLLLAGNKYGMEVETNRCDAGNGAFLRGDGKGNFSWMDNRQSGFWATKEVRDLALLQATGGKWKVVVANNNAAAQVFGGH